MKFKMDIFSKAHENAGVEEETLRIIFERQH